MGLSGSGKSTIIRMLNGLLKPTSGRVFLDQVELTALSFAELWELPQRVQDRSTVAGVQPKISYHSRSLIGGKVGRVILKFSPDEAWRGVLENEALFLAAAPKAGLTAARAEVVQDREGVRALAVARFDRTVSTEGRLVRHAQEDATQVLGLRPGQKYDPDARTVLTALSLVCTAPPVAAPASRLISGDVIDAHRRGRADSDFIRASSWSPSPKHRNNQVIG
jgi:energy-coupling factor transporter ATP-binding protein EcfA2